MRIFLEFLRSVLVMGLLGLAAGFIYAKFIYTKLIGGLRAGMIVSTVGCIVGGFMFNVIFDMPFIQKLNSVPYVQVLLVNKFDINFIAAFLGIWMFLYMYRQISSQNH